VWTFSSIIVAAFESALKVAAAAAVHNETAKMKTGFDIYVDFIIKPITSLENISISSSRPL
jgi:hypothetical protein